MAIAKSELFSFCRLRIQIRLLYEIPFPGVLEPQDRELARWTTVGSSGGAKIA